MTKEEKRQRIQQLENELMNIGDKQNNIEKIKIELQRPDRTLGLKLFTSIGESDEDYHGKQVWIESSIFIKPSMMLKLYELELEEKKAALMTEMNSLIA